MSSSSSSSSRGIGSRRKKVSSSSSSSNNRNKKTYENIPPPSTSTSFTTSTTNNNPDWFKTAYQQNHNQHINEFFSDMEPIDDHVSSEESKVVVVHNEINYNELAFEFAITTNNETIGERIAEVPTAVSGNFFIQFSSKLPKRKIEISKFIKRCVLESQRNRSIEQLRLFSAGLNELLNTPRPISKNIHNFDEYMEQIELDSTSSSSSFEHNSVFLKGVEKHLLKGVGGKRNYIVLLPPSQAIEENNNSIVDIKEYLVPKSGYNSKDRTMTTMSNKIYQFDQDGMFLRALEDDRMIAFDGFNPKKIEFPSSSLKIMTFEIGERL